VFEIHLLFYISFSVPTTTQPPIDVFVLSDDDEMEHLTIQLFLFIFVSSICTIFCSNKHEGQLSANNVQTISRYPSDGDDNGQFRTREMMGKLFFIFIFIIFRSTR
jgi:hypothetical protein